MRKLDDFEQLLVLSQSDGNVCLFKHVPSLQAKFAELQVVFDKVDRYEKECKNSFKVDLTCNWDEMLLKHHKRNPISPYQSFAIRAERP